MCDYSLQMVKSRPAKVGDKLVTKQFPSGSTGFTDLIDSDVAVCVMPGTEIAFGEQPSLRWSGFFGRNKYARKFDKVAVFRQIDKDQAYTHHDALEFPDGTVQKLNTLTSGLSATVLQLPAAPKTKEEAKEQERLEVVG